MKYIRSCENCYREIRFPIDKGTLFIICPYCKKSFKINPDDPQLYTQGRFDLNKYNQKYPEEFFFSQQHNSEFSQTPDSKKTVKIVIVVSLFFLLISHIFKIYNTSQEMDGTQSPPQEIYKEPKKTSEPEYEI